MQTLGTMLTVVIMLATLCRLASAQTYSYTIVDTGQTTYYNDQNGVITVPPAPSDPFYGQDAQYDGNQPDYDVIAGGAVVEDNVTGLFWTQSIDIDGVAGIDAGDKLTRAALDARVTQLNSTAYGGRTDWRAPTVKELYSVIRFDGIQPRPQAATGAGGAFFLDGSVFDFEWGDVASGDRIIDMQVWSSTDYTSVTMVNDQSFMGVNFADGRIKGYPLQTPRSGADGEYYAMLVAGNPDYGVNGFVDNGDGTITDRATGLEWTQEDSPLRMNWEDVLADVQQKNEQNHLGHDDWRLPNAKELHSLVDYTRSPDATSSPAIDPLFQLTATEQTAGDFTDANGDYGFHWTGTTFLELDQTGSVRSSSAVYISFFEVLGNPFGTVLDVHGAGAQRTDPKTVGDRSPGDFFGPQGDYISINNYALLVRAVPEPSTIVMAVFGLVGLVSSGFWQRRRRR